jgi:hypothetical protein
MASFPRLHRRETLVSQLFPLPSLNCNVIHSFINTYVK